MTLSISRDAYIRYLSSRKAEFVDDYGKGWSAGINTAIRACEKFPAVDVVPLALLEKWLYEMLLITWAQEAKRMRPSRRAAKRSSTGLTALEHL